MENQSQKEKRKEYKQKCKELGGFINVAYKDGEYLLNDINISPSNKFRLLYLATYLDYYNRGKNILIKHGKNNKIEYLNKKDIKNLLNLSDSTFKRFYNEVKEKELLFEANNKIYLNSKYFKKGRGNFKSLKLFIKSMRELYYSIDPINHKVIFNILKLIPLSTNNYIKTGDILMDKADRSKFIKKIILKTENLLITSREIGKIKINENLINKKSIFEELYPDYEELICSKGEKKIVDFLHEYEINFIKEKEFNGLIGLGGDPLRYDFYLPNFNLLIEFHGRQHKEFTPFFHRTKRDFKRQKTHDKMKMKYAYDNDIDILIIWYYSYEDIEYILYQHLFN